MCEKSASRRRARVVSPCSQVDAPRQLTTQAGMGSLHSSLRDFDKQGPTGAAMQLDSVNAALLERLCLCDSCQQVRLAYSNLYDESLLTLAQRMHF